jgi:NADH-quinone oxidoreductase subunit A
MNAVIVWPILVYFALVLIVAGVMLGGSYLLGERHREKLTGEPYESGLPVTGSARLRFDVKFYLVAMFFVIFDLETAFLFGWAIAARPLGWAGYAEAVVFVVVLLVALIYLGRVGALEWGSSRRRAHQIQKAKE